MADSIEVTDPVEQLKEQLADDRPGDYVYCRLCHFPITSQSESISIGIAHRHRFTNPDNITYTIGCYRNAPGCSIGGLPTEEYSWFGGYRWQMAQCSNCYQQLGWYYQHPSQRYFFGLIINRLSFSPDRSDNAG